MQKRVSFSGIVRNTDCLLASDGECMELVNMRLRDGSLEPVAPPSLLATLPYEYSAVYNHASVSVHMCIKSDDGSVHLYDKDFRPLASASDDAPTLLSDEAVGIKRIEFLGNIACLFAENLTYYAIFDTDHYKWLGTRPTLPTVSVTVESVVQQVTTDEEYYAGLSRNEENASLYWRNVSKGYFDECVAKLNERGYFIDRALFRYAFRLFDGSYICCSPIIYVDDRNSVSGLSRDGGNFVSQATDSSTGYSKYTAKVQGFKPSFHFSSFNLAAWENIVVSMDIFSSGSIPGHKVVNNGERVVSRSEGVYTSPSYGYEQYSAKSNSELWNDVVTHSMFYKIAEYDIKGVRTGKQDNVSLSQLALCEALTDADTSNVERSAAYTYLFNGRLHLASLREQLFKGYDGAFFLPAGMVGVQASAVVGVELKTTYGTSVVKRIYDGNFEIYYDGTNYRITPFLMYPDARAKAMTLCVSVGGKHYRKSFRLTQHGTLNHACYLNTSGGGLALSVDYSGSQITLVRILSSDNIMAFFSYKQGCYTLTYSAAEQWWLYDGRKFTLNTAEDPDTYYPTYAWLGTPADGDTIVFTIAEAVSSDDVEAIEDIKIDASWELLDTAGDIVEKNTVEVRENVMKVSAVDNPFDFPSKQTYTPSNEPIVAVCSNTVALSQGQFGQHPLYIFCADGVWAMSVDTSGSVVYSGCYPLSREVCINSRSVRGIDSGVVFITSKGVMMLQGGSLKLLSSALNAVAHPLQGVGEQSIFRRIAAICSIGDVWSNDDFLLFSREAVIGFNYTEQELIVANENYPYSYLFSLENGTWSKLLHGYRHIMNSYPHFVGIDNVAGSTILTTFADDKSAQNSVLLISRPMLWGGKLYKRVLQMMLHAVVRPATNVDGFSGLACYILCSNDGVNFKLVTGSERREAFSDIIFPYMPTQSYRYFAIAITGRISVDSKITAAELYIDAAWNNRLR